MPVSTPLTPSPLTLREALGESVPLARLRAAMAESNARFETIRPALPAGLRTEIRPGPVDAEGWSLLASNAAVAAKLRQLRPDLEQQLRAAGWAAPAIRIKVTRT